MAIAGGPIKMGQRLLGIKNFFKTWKTQGFKAAMGSIKKGSDSAKDALEKQMITDKAKIKILKKLETQALRTGNALERMKTGAEPAKEAAKDAAAAGTNAINDVDAAASGDTPDQAPKKKSIRDKIKSRMSMRNEGGFVDLSGARKNLVDTDKVATKTTGKMKKAFTGVGKAGKGMGRGLKMAGGGLMALTGGPLGAVMLAIPLIIKGFQYLYKHSPAFRKFVDGIVEKLKQFGEWAKKIMEEYVLPALEKFFGWVNENLPKVKEWFKDLGDKLKKVGEGIGKAWDAVVQYFKDVKQSFKDDVAAIKGAWESLKKGTVKVFTAIKDFFKKHWKLILSILTGPIGALVIFVVSHWDEIKEKTGILVDKIKEKFELFKDKVTDLKDSLKEKIEAIKDFFSGIPEAVSDAFANLGANAKSGINAFIGMINDHLIKPINNKLGKVGISIPEIPTMATGGRVTGSGGPTQDNQLRALSVGEYVIRSAAAQQIGYDRLDRANRTGQLAGGGGGDVWQIYPSQGMDETELAHKIYRQVRFNRRAGA
jgi:hypothetical protein